jgi:adenylate cyclase class IV
MARNVEIKARLLDRQKCVARAEQLADGPAEVIEQEDVFFACDTGRLKLRLLSPGRGELIYYERGDERGPKTSRYFVAPTREPGALREVMERALGARAVVKKRRLLFMAGRTRVLGMNPAAPRRNTLSTSRRRPLLAQAGPWLVS